jgi:hypothetical protein
MDGPGELLVALLLFVGLFLNWIKAAVSVAIAVLIRHRSASLLAVLVVGAFEGLVGSSLELFDLYLTREGWASIDTLALITIALSALASLAWWCIARATGALARRVLRPAAAR